MMIAGFTYLGLTDESSMPIKEPTHSCESREAMAYCFDVRDYGDKIDYRCLYNEGNLRTYFSCPEGWKEIPIQKEIAIIPTQSGDRYICSPNECILVTI